MKTSIFDATLTLPPMVEMTEVEKDMPGMAFSYATPCKNSYAGESRC